MAVINITEENFEAEVLQSDKPGLRDCWAVWCGPCQIMAPSVAEVAAERGDIKVGKVNVDEQGELAARFDVMSIPTLMVFKGGRVVHSSVGVRPKEEVLALL